MRTKKPFMSVYKTFYDPAKEGFGNPQSWQNAFKSRMGINEAKKILKDLSPWQTLKVPQSATFEEIKKAHRQMVMKHHPDRGGDEAEFKRIQAAYEILEEKFT
jgi:DnaJ-domain-containing protein 1